MASPRPTVEVQWDEGQWEDATDDLIDFAEGHGGATANPDRPLVESAQGAMLLSSAPASTGRRHRCRATLEGDTLFDGWAQDRRATGNGDEVTFALEGGSKRELERPIGIDRAAGNAADLFTDTAIAGLGRITTRNLPRRRVLAVNYAGPAGGYLSRAALINSAELMENRVGKIVAANPHIVDAPAAVVVVDAAATTLLNVDAVELQSRIRNIITIRTPAVHLDEQRNYTAQGTVRAPQYATPPPHAWGAAGTLVIPDLQVVEAQFEVPAADNVVWVDWMVDAVAEWSVIGHLQGQYAATYSTNPGNPGVGVTLYVTPTTTVTLPVPAAQVAPSFAGLAGSTATARAAIDTTTAEQWVQDVSYGRTSNSHRDIAAWIANGTLPVGRRYTRRRSRSSGMIAYPTGLPTPSTVPTPVGQFVTAAEIEGLLNVFGWADDPNAITVRFAVEVTRRVPNVIPARTVEVANNPSQARWGPRHLELPPWLADTTPAGLEAQLSSLGEARREHSFTIPLTEAVARTLDAGDYALLQVRDPRIGAAVNRHCLIVGRELSFGSGRLPTVRFRALETGVAGDPNPVYLGATANPVYLGAVDQPVHLAR